MTDRWRYDEPAAALIARWSAELDQALLRTAAIRLGETTILSRRVHLQRPDYPGEVRICDADAGQAFYCRRQRDEIMHADIFHEMAAVDQHQLARAISAACEAWQDSRPTDWAGAGRPTDYLDLQTGLGGGRVSGTLNYGQKPELRSAHLNHVHLASGLPPTCAPLLIWVIAAIERAVLAQGVQLRRIERIVPEPSGQARLDLNDCADVTDSLLRETTPTDDARGLDPGDLAALVSLADEFGGVEEARDILAALRARGDGDLRQVAGRALTELTERGIAAVDQRHVPTLTAFGDRLRQALACHQREVELEFRRLIRQVPLPLKHNQTGHGEGGRRQVERTGPVLRVRPLSPDEWLTDLAPAETIARARARALSEGGPASPWSIDKGDLCLRERGRLRPVDLCLLVDASASMAGKRIRAARYLAEHILLATRDRVAVITFQERQVDVRIPLTRSYARALSGLRQIRPQGLTPLAHGLLAAADYLRTIRAVNPMLVVVTDGIPTVPEWSLNPIADACRAAEEIANRRIPFLCIGLEPNREFLQQLAKAGHGRLHVVAELDRERMVEAIHRERT